MASWSSGRKPDLINIATAFDHNIPSSCSQEIGNKVDINQPEIKVQMETYFLYLSITYRFKKSAAHSSRR